METSLDSKQTLQPPDTLHRFPMGRPVDQNVVAAYAAAFAAEAKLKSVGFSFLCDISGRLFKSKRVALKDMNGNTEAELLQKIKCLFQNVVSVCFQIFFFVETCSKPTY